jgi:hypothetical protein
MSERLDFARVNIREDEGRSIARKYRVNMVPTFLVIAPDGELLYRQVGGRPDRAEVEAALASR